MRNPRSNDENCTPLDFLCSYKSFFYLMKMVCLFAYIPLSTIFRIQLSLYKMFLFLFSLHECLYKAWELITHGHSHWKKKHEERQLSFVIHNGSRSLYYQRIMRLFTWVQLCTRDLNAYWNAFRVRGNVATFERRIKRKKQRVINVVELRESGIRVKWKVYSRCMDAELFQPFLFTLGALFVIYSSASVL